MHISDKSSWREEKPHKQFPKLTTPLDVDVAIIGGGITGVLAAYLLRKSGKSVALLEGGSIGDWASGSTTGFLMEIIDTDVSDLIARWDLESAQLITKSHRDAITSIEKIVQEEHISCEFMRCPAYIYARTNAEARNLWKEVDALIKVGTRASLESSSRIPIRNCGYIQVETQAKFHSLKFLFALADVCDKAGIKIFEHTEVADIKEGAINTLHIKDGPSVRAKYVLVATHYPFMKPQPAKLKFKKAWYTTYVLEAHIGKNVLPEALYEDSGIPYHYARIDKKGEYDRLILGGEDHRSDVPVGPEKSFAALESYLKEVLPSLKYKITRKWKGRIVESGDGLAFIGPTSNDSVFYATGYSGTGLTYGVIAAELFADYVGGVKNPVQKIYAANRPFSLRTFLPKALEYMKEFAGGAVKNTFLIEKNR